MKNVSSYIGKTALAALIASTLFVVGCADQRGFDVKRLPPVPSVSEKGGPNGGASDGSDTSTVIPQDQDQMDSSALDRSGQDQPQKDVSGVDSDQSGKDQPHSDSESQGEQPEKPRKQSDEQAKQDLAQLVDTNVITYSEVEKLKEEQQQKLAENPELRQAQQQDPVQEIQDQVVSDDKQIQMKADLDKILTNTKGMPESSRMVKGLRLSFLNQVPGQSLEVEVAAVLKVDGAEDILTSELQMTAQTGKSVIYGSTKNVKFRSNRTDLVVEVLGMCDVQKGCESVRVALSLKPNSAAPQVFMGYFEKRGSDYVFTMSDPELKTFDQALATAGSAGSVTGGEPAPATDATTDQAKVPTQQTAPVVNPELPANKAGAKNPAPVKRVLNPELPSNKVGAKNVPNLNQGATQQGLRDKQLDRSLKQKSLNQGAAQQGLRDKQLDRSLKQKSLNQGAAQQGLRDKQLDRSLKQKSLNQGAAQQAFRDKQLDRK